MEQWDYKIMFIDADRWTPTGLPEDELGQTFAAAGDEGWELVKVEPLLRGGFLFFGCGGATKTSGFVAFFKRPKA